MKTIKSLLITLLMALAANVNIYAMDNSNNNNANNNTTFYDTQEESNIPSLKNLTARYVAQHYDTLNVAQHITQQYLTLDAQELIQCELLMKQNSQILPWILKQLEQTAITRHVLQGHTKRILCAKIHKSIFITGSEDTTAKVWDLETGTCLHTLAGPDGHTAQINDVDINQDIAITGSEDNTAKVWDLKTGKCLYTLQETGPVTSVRLNSNKLITASNNHATVWNLKTGQYCYTLQETGSITSFISNQNSVITIANNNESRAKIWNLKTGQYTHDLPITGSYNIIASNDDGSLIVIISDNIADIWDLKIERHIQRVITNTENNIGQIWFSDDNKYLYIESRTEKRTIQVFDIQTKKVKTLTNDDASSLKDRFLTIPKKNDPKSIVVFDLQKLFICKNFLNNNLTLKQAQLIIAIYNAIQAKQKYLVKSEEKPILNQLPTPIQELLISHCVVHTAIGNFRKNMTLAHHQHQDNNNNNNE